MAKLEDKAMNFTIVADDTVFQNDKIIVDNPIDNYGLGLKEMFKSMQKDCKAKKGRLFVKVIEGG